MKEAIKVRILQGDSVIRDARNAALPPLFRGLPKIEDKACAEGCGKCAEICPTNAIELNPLKIDIGLCVFCPLCEENCPEKIILFTNNYHLGASEKQQLVISKGTREIKPEIAARKLRNYFGKSLKLRQVSAGGCNGCELELNALSNVNFDMKRYGIDFTASPRHSDGIAITGPFTKNMAKATEICLEAVPNPKIIILFGACAISGGIFQNSEQIDRGFLNANKIDLYIPGCPPHPLTFINALIDWLDKK